MTSTEIDATAVTARSANEIGQATAVEQARAVAEVQGAIVVAQQCPRSTTTAIQQMRESCSQKSFAERAFFRYSRAGSQISGPSVHFARELARCWGNMQYGIAELRRDDFKGESEMVAFAWDVQTNTRATTTFIVKHLRDTKQGTKKLTDQRDLYENNANNGARRLREQILAILPKWFTEEAEDLCSKTLLDGGDKPLAQRVADAQRVWDGKGITTDQLERKLGRAADKWTPHDLAQLVVVWKSVDRGEATLDDEFPDQKVSLEEITGAPADAAKANGRTRPAQTQPEPANDTDPTDEDIAAMNEEARQADAERAAAGSGSGLFS